MPWKVISPASDATGRHVKAVLESVSSEELHDEELRMIAYWIRNMEPGEKVVIERFHPEQSG
jgi:pyruvate-formate lyase-activating enzyme